MFAFDHSYASLPPKFFRRVHPTPVEAPHLIAYNRALAMELGLTELDPAAPETASLFAGNALPEGALPIAMAYAGHQFGNFVPQLGDGRAILIGEIIDQAGKRRDIQLKGSGPTPFSRNGDGRAALGPVLREYLVSEAMHALGIPATRSLAAVLTGEQVYRETRLPGAVLTRVAASHIRVGTFQFFAARGDREGLTALVDHVIERHYPDAAGTGNPALSLLEAVSAAQARLVARWMGVGFIHGVMNTDNMAVSGETIDFGPCAFLDTYDPKKVFSSIDRTGRYAYQNQPAIAQWNLARLAETLLGLIDENEEAAVAKATKVLEDFAGHYEAAWLAVFRNKLGLTTPRDEDPALINWLLSLMHQGQADFTLAFRRLTDLAADPVQEGRFRAAFADGTDISDWLAAWRERLASSGHPSHAHAVMLTSNPAFIPRNHRIEQIIIQAMNGDYGPFHAFNAVLSRPYDDQPGNVAWAEPPLPDEEVTRTFCGT